MRTSQPLSPIRLARFFAWALLWLMRYSRFLLEGGPRARPYLNAITHAVACLIFLRANAMTPPPPPRLHRSGRPPFAPRGFVRRTYPRGKRVVIGSLVLRRLRVRGVGARLRALFHALINPDELAAKLAKQLERGYTRLFPIVPVCPPAEVLTTRTYAPAILAADTS